MTMPSTPMLMLAIGLLWLLLGAVRWITRPAARLQARIWLLVGVIFVAVGVWMGP